MTRPLPSKLVYASATGGGENEPEPGLVFCTRYTRPNTSRYVFVVLDAPLAVTLLHVLPAQIVLPEASVVVVVTTPSLPRLLVTAEPVSLEREPSTLRAMSSSEPSGLRM